LYLQLVSVEEAFKNLKSLPLRRRAKAGDDLAIRPIFHQDEARIEAHILIAFLAYRLHVTLGRRLHALAPGLTPRSVIENFAAVQMIDLHVPTTDDRELLLTRYTEPKPELALLLDKLKFVLLANRSPKSAPLRSHRHPRRSEDSEGPIEVPTNEIEGRCHGAANEQTIDAGGLVKLRADQNPDITDDMRSGPDQRSRGRFNPNRPFRPQPRVPQSGQTFDSSGPDVRVRGTARQVFERYVTLAREAATSGDRIAVENLYQHAEHYFRISNARREGNSQQSPRPTTPTDVATDTPESGSGGEGIDREQPRTNDDFDDF
jgi:Domain of unknown function (DUF4167)